MQKRSSGFTLIELAVVFGIVGLLLYFGIGIVSSLRESTALKRTELRLAKAQEAIITFVADNLRLPCPADGSLPSTDNDYGVEVAFVSGSCRAIGASGVIPWVTLGLSDEETLDGFARRISYRVATAVPAPVNPDMWRTTLPGIRGLLTIHSDAPVGLGRPPPASQNQINACSPTPGDNTCNNFAVAVLLSHGENGSGAFLPGTGNRVPLPPGARELENTDADNAFVQRGFVRDTTLPAGEFDDILVWLNPGNVVTPLIESGTIQTARGVVQTNINAIKAAIMGWIRDDEAHCPPADLSLLTSLPPATLLDPWNQNLVYDNPGNCGALAGEAFSIWSAGPTSGVDEELLKTVVTIEQVRGWLTMAGVDLSAPINGSDGGASEGSP